MIPNRALQLKVKWGDNQDLTLRNVFAQIMKKIRKESSKNQQA